MPPFASKNEITLNYTILSRLIKDSYAKFLSVFSRMPSHLLKLNGVNLNGMKEIQLAIESGLIAKPEANSILENVFSELAQFAVEGGEYSKGQF